MHADVIRYLYENYENLLEILKAYLTQKFLFMFMIIFIMSVAFWYTVVYVKQLPDWPHNWKVYKMTTSYYVVYENLQS